MSTLPNVPLLPPSGRAGNAAAHGPARQQFEAHALAGGGRDADVDHLHLPDHALAGSLVHADLWQPERHCDVRLDQQRVDLARVTIQSRWQVHGDQAWSERPAPEFREPAQACTQATICIDGTRTTDPEQRIDDEVRRRQQGLMQLAIEIVFRPHECPTGSLKLLHPQRVAAH